MITSSFIKKTIQEFKSEVGIDGRQKCTNENLEKVDDWFIRSNYDPKGIEGQIELEIIHTFVNDFVYKEYSFSTKRFMNEYSKELINDLNQKYFHQGLSDDKDTLGNFSLSGTEITYHDGLKKTLDEQEWIELIEYLVEHNYSVKGTVSIGNESVGYSINKDVISISQDEVDKIIDSAIQKDVDGIKSYVLQDEYPNIIIDRNSIHYDDTSYVNNTVASFFIDFSFELTIMNFIDYYGDPLFGFDCQENNILNVKCKTSK